MKVLDMFILVLIDIAISIITINLYLKFTVKSIKNIDSNIETQIVAEKINQQMNIYFNSPSGKKLISEKINNELQSNNRILIRLPKKIVKQFSEIDANLLKQIIMEQNWEVLE